MIEPSIAFCRNPTGARIAYATWGSGPVLVIPPGWVSHLELQWHYLGMQALCARLAESFRLVFYDRRGVGLSERVRDDDSLEGELADLETVIDRAAPAEPVALLGASHAGPLAIAFAAAHPDRTRALALYGTFARGQDVAPPHVQRSLAELVRASWGLGARALATIFVPGAEPAFAERLVRFQRESTDRSTAAQLLELGFRLDVTARLRDLHTPTLVIARRDDRAIASRLSVELASEIEGARLVMLEGDTHFPWLGDWESIAELLEDFLGARRVATRPAPRPEPPAPRETSRVFRVLHYRVDARPEQASRIAIAQIGAPEDLPVPGPSGLFRLPEARVGAVREKLRTFAARAADAGAQLVVFPEMSVDLGHEALDAEVCALARAHDLMIVTGGHHDETTRANVCTVVGPEGVLWRQRKHIPALLRSLGGAGSGDWIEEPIDVPLQPLFVVASSRVGRIAIAICRDFLDLDLRVALKNTEPPIDLLLNPAFTPVTADFDSAHAEARRALYACTVFCNFAAFGGSLATSPEKGAAKLAIPCGEERLEVLDVPLFDLRAERAAWDARAHARFVQSTRHG